MSRNAYTTLARPDGATVELWSAACKDCGFVSGMAVVRWPNGYAIGRTGAGCYDRDRRTPAAMRAWALAVPHPQEAT